MYFVPVVKFNKKHYLVCPICSRISKKLSNSEVEYLKNYVSQTGASCNSYSSKGKNLYVKFSIGAENIDIIKKKGFGLFGYNVDDFAYCLFGFNDALKSYLKEKSEEYDYLNIILKNWLEYSYVDPNTALCSFIAKNKDFYKKELEKAEKIKKEN